MSGPNERLRHHVTGAIERGESVAIVEQPPKYAEKEIRSSTRYPCGAFVAGRGCRNQAVLLFIENQHTPQETIKACACQRHRDTIRRALKEPQS